MDWVREKRADGLGGMLLCDTMGLRKMREAIGYLLTRRLERGRRIQEARLWKREIMRCTNRFLLLAITVITEPISLFKTDF